jgi:hypothetical protein
VTSFKTYTKHLQGHKDKPQALSTMIAGILVKFRIGYPRNKGSEHRLSKVIGLDSYCGVLGYDNKKFYTLQVL